eukprot:2691961-Karenia_brevis.AAC.1
MQGTQSPNVDAWRRSPEDWDHFLLAMQTAWEERMAEERHGKDWGAPKPFRKWYTNATQRPAATTTAHQDAYGAPLPASTAGDPYASTEPSVYGRTASKGGLVARASPYSIDRLTKGLSGAPSSKSGKGPLLSKGNKSLSSVKPIPASDDSDEFSADEMDVGTLLSVSWNISEYQHTSAVLQTIFDRAGDYKHASVKLLQDT